MKDATDFSSQLIYPRAHWQHLDGIPASFNPASHTHNLDDLVAAANDVLRIGHPSTNNEAEVVIDTSIAGSPQLGFTEHGDMSWAVGGDDDDNSFKIHGVAGPTIPTINGLAMPFFELTTSGDLYLQKKLYTAGHKIFDADGKLYYDDIDITNYVHSRGQNLLTNGSALLGNNTNFRNFTFDGSEAYYSPGSFQFYGSGTVFTDEYMPVNVNKRYAMEVDAKTLGATGRYYMMTACFDVDKLSINANHHMYRANTLTTLAQPLNNGDTIVYLTDATNWDNSGTAGVNTHLRSIITWDYTNSYGYTYPPETYSRNWLGNAWDPGAINFTNNTITLRVPWTGGYKAAGTPLSNGSSGGSYKYNVWSSVYVPTTWTSYVGYMDGVDLSGTNVSTKFPPGTAFIKLGWLMNYQGSGETIWLTNLSVSEDYDHWGLVVGGQSGGASREQQSGMTLTLTAGNNIDLYYDDVGNQVYVSFYHEGEVDIESGDHLMIADNSDSNKLKRSDITFGTDDGTFLARDGNFKSALKKTTLLSTAFSFSTTSVAKTMPSSITGKTIYVSWSLNSDYNECYVSAFQFHSHDNTPVYGFATYYSGYPIQGYNWRLVSTSSTNLSFSTGQSWYITPSGSYTSMGNSTQTIYIKEIYTYD
jgi:hypothetical protein